MTAEMDATQQTGSAPPVDHNLEDMDWQEEEELKLSLESSEGTSDENADAQEAGAAWAVPLRDPALVSLRKLHKDISRSATESANNIKRYGYNRHNMNLLTSLLDRSHKMSKDNERIYRDIAAVITEEEGTDTGSAQGNYNPAVPFSCQKFEPIPVLLLQKLLEHAKSVGIIFVKVESGGSFVCGTCFRVGTKYVMTCKHVLDIVYKYLAEDPTRKAFVEFNFVKDLQIFEQIRFQIKQVTWHNDTSDLDYCVLELSIPADLTEKVKIHLRALGPVVCDVEHSGTITLVGHPGCGYKAMDPNCPYPQPDVGVYLKLNPEPKGDFSQLSDPRRVTYCSVMGHGSSGSPGFNREGHLVVMHARGYRPHDQNIEQGVKMMAIRDDLRKSHPALCEELFPTSTTRGVYTETAV